MTAYSNYVCVRHEIYCSFVRDVAGVNSLKYGDFRVKGMTSLRGCFVTKNNHIHSLLSPSPTLKNNLFTSTYLFLSVKHHHISHNPYSYSLHHIFTHWVIFRLFCEIPSEILTTTFTSVVYILDVGGKGVSGDAFNLYSFCVYTKRRRVRLPKPRLKTSSRSNS